MIWIVHDLGDLRDVAKEISVMIGDQGQDINQIDSNVGAANEHVIKAVEETKKVITPIHFHSSIRNIIKTMI